MADFHSESSITGSHPFKKLETQKGSPIHTVTIFGGGCPPPNPFTLASRHAPTAIGFQGLMILGSGGNRRSNTSPILPLADVLTSRRQVREGRVEDGRR